MAGQGQEALLTPRKHSIEPWLWGPGSGVHLLPPSMGCALWVPWPLQDHSSGIPFPEDMLP